MPKIMLLLVALIFCAITGCASNLMQPVNAESLPQLLQEDQAAVIFFRPSSFGGAIQAPVIEGASGDRLELVGIVSSGYKVLYMTTPGLHYFVVGGESSDLLEAHLEGGKFYYVLVDPRMGGFKARFALVPMLYEQLGTKDFNSDMQYCKWVVPKPEAEQWFKDNWPSLQSKYKAAMVEADRNILLPEHGSQKFYQ